MIPADGGAVLKLAELADALAVELDGPRGDDRRRLVGCRLGDVLAHDG